MTVSSSTEKYVLNTKHRDRDNLISLSFSVLHISFYEHFCTKPILVRLIFYGRRWLVNTINFPNHLTNWTVLSVFIKSLHDDGGVWCVERAIDIRICWAFIAKCWLMEWQRSELVRCSMNVRKLLSMILNCIYIYSRTSFVFWILDTPHDHLSMIVCCVCLSIWYNIYMLYSYVEFIVRFLPHCISKWKRNFSPKRNKAQSVCGLAILSSAQMVFTCNGFVVCAVIPMIGALDQCTHTHSSHFLSSFNFFVAVVVVVVVSLERAFCSVWFLFNKYT